MKQLKERLIDGATIFSDTHKVYKRLQKHLDSQPVGFPATLSGVERRILREVFTVDEAKLALELDYKFLSFEAVFEKVKKRGISETDLQTMLDNMEKHGAIFVKIVNGLKEYALHPFAVGIFEMKLPTMNANFYIDVRKYLYQGFAMEFLSTSHAQLRVIPVEKSITPDLNIATYDEVRELVLQSGDRISLADCVCRKGKDAIGRSCQETDRRETCIGLGDFADMYSRNGFGRTISKEEAFEVLAENEKEGLVLMPSNYLASNFICSCCKCCCGCLELVSMLAHPAEYVKNNYFAALNTESCIGCGKCARTCKLEAIEMEGKKASAIDMKRCIGCGVCVATCKSGALYLKKKDIQTVPPKDLDTLYDLIMENKKGTIKRIFHMGKILIR
jgi:formate hydrogenlyase subunit 6/NADH:ubiquinone oxidoreductase subunit I